MSSIISHHSDNLGKYQALKMPNLGLSIQQPKHVPVEYQTSKSAHKIFIMSIQLQNEAKRNFRGKEKSLTYLYGICVIEWNPNLDGQQFQDDKFKCKKIEIVMGWMLRKRHWNFIICHHKMFDDFQIRHP